MPKKLTRKEKLKIRIESSQPIVITQGKYFKRSSYLLLAIGLFCAVTILPDFKLPDTEIDETYIIILVLTTVFLVWMFFLIPLLIITTTKTITHQNNQIKIESNRAKYIINSYYDELIWWTKLDTEWGGVFHMKFKSKKISLSNLEFSGLYKLENFLKQNYSNKEKAGKLQ